MYFYANLKPVSVDEIYRTLRTHGKFGQVERVLSFEGNIS